MHRSGRNRNRADDELSVLATRFPLYLPVQPFCLALHVFYDDGVQFAEGGGVLQNLPRGVGVVMHLDDVFVADNQQAIALGAVLNAVVDGVLVEVVAFD